MDGDAPRVTDAGPPRSGPAPVPGKPADSGASAAPIRYRRAKYLTIAVVVGAAAGAPVVAAGLTPFGLLVGWDVTAVVYMGLLWTRLWPLDGTALAARAQVTDPTRLSTDLLLLVASLASLVAVGFALARAGQSHGWLELAHVGLGLVSVVVSWATIHTVFSLRYAALYYRDPIGGVAFPCDDDPGPDPGPRFSDFAYLGFTIGMTFQVSDTNLTSAAMRRTALPHALLSFLFGTGILATTINLVASLTSS